MTAMVLPAEALSAMEHYKSRARAANTCRTYWGQWARFVTWCTAHNVAPLPAEADVVAAYVAARAQSGASIATVNVMLSAIIFAHTTMGMAFARYHPSLRLVLDGIRRTHVRGQQQAEPLTAELLREVLRAAGDTLLERRDAALLALLYTFALRASEAVALDWGQPGKGRGWLKIAPDRGEIALLGSKAAPVDPETVIVPAHAAPSALQTITDWVQHARIGPGEPLLLPVARGGHVRAERLAPGAVGRIVKRAISRHLERKGVAPGEALAMANRFGGHSGRVGFCVSASEAGVLPTHVAAVARHAGLAMAYRYARRADLFRCAPHLTAGVGV